jgi:hypothetical protein
LGVPEWLINIVASLDKAAQVCVLTAHGLSRAYHPETGWPQGSEEGPIGWLTHYDWNLQVQEEVIGRDPYRVDNMFPGDVSKVTRTEEDAQQWGLQCVYKAITVVGTVFADDARLLAASREGITIGAETSEDFLGFHGGANNIPKSGLTSGLWEGHTDDPKAMGFKADMTPLTIERVERTSSGKVQYETFTSKTGYETEKYLGLSVTATVTYGETEEIVAEKVRYVRQKAKAARNKVAGTAVIVRQVAVP